MPLADPKRITGTLDTFILWSCRFRSKLDYAIGSAGGREPAANRLLVTSSMLLP